ncbi:MAG: nucleotide sugar dehydrogenase [Myxococcota bacterium]|nr:nucleotide sugar dehydrogenase [Myxococcota bacterium]
MSERMAIIGLGYVGLPVAVAFARQGFTVVGYDLDTDRVASLKRGVDPTGEVSGEALAGSGLTCTDDARQLQGCTMFVVTVPTPVDENRQPDLTALLAASETIGTFLNPGAVVVYESTVYPGVTEEVCGPVLANASGLVQGRDFKLAYSPERINPGDDAHTFDTVVKVVGAEDGETLERVASAYETVVSAGIHRCPSIRVAEASKVIENTQRDLNIALMNEFALILDRLDIRTADVLAAARTKWNFLPFRPGLVGGHCIGVDPYYLTSKAEGIGYHPDVILAGRRLNDGMGAFVAQKLVRMLVDNSVNVREARVGILGLAFKENVPDLRNSGTARIVEELRSFGIDPLVVDPHANSAEAMDTYGIQLVPLDGLGDLDALVLAVPHDAFLQRETSELLKSIQSGGILVDICAALDPEELSDAITTWSL